METIEAIQSRRSINFFDENKAVPIETIMRLVELAATAPSSYNLQPWETVIVADPGRKDVLRKCAYGQAKITEASAVLIIIANPGALEENIDRVIADRIEKGYMKPEDAQAQRKAPYKLYGDKESETRRIFAVKNAALFAMNFMIAAKGMGFDTHPMDGFVAEDVKREFHIPDDRIITLLIAVGYPKPDLKLLPRPFRRSTAEVVRMNDYESQG